MENEEEKQEKKRKDKKQRGWVWPVKVLFLAIFLSFSFSILSELALSNAVLVVAIIVVLVFILISIVFDMLGVAVTSSSIEPFLAMASRKVTGSKQAISLIKNADRIAVINEGELAELGTHDELMQIPYGKYKALYEMQFQKQAVPV